MTDLQMSLMAIGGTIVVGVISYNKWQEYKARKTVERAFASEHEDVLMRVEPQIDAHSAARQEPGLEPANADQSAEPAQPAHEAPSHESSADDAAESPIVPPVAFEKELPIDDMIDCLIPISLSSPVRGERVLGKIQALRHVGNKPVHYIGQREDGSWEEVAHGGVYHALQVGLQIANRSKPLNEIEYSEFIAMLRQVTDDIDAEIEVPDMTRVMEHARGLHQFVSEHDAQLSVNVRSNGAPWAINTLLAALERQGFDLRPDGRLVMPDGDGGVLFSVSTNVTLAAETTSLLTLLLDVPRVAPSFDGFGAMTACARMLANRLDGTVVDDGGQPLAEGALAEIAEQVRSFYEHMESSGIPAGSPRAQRLFS
ncbi:Cell division protein ZipA, interacts with FtsZ [Noviherbaspirillum humi]|uniref:Cell division protein ZipA n=1 Tax=Noviherbaspirillum humi TaxID=1688639 RepID=A0A239H5F9_9BURK|nr:cell division protein ZipA C-terminal FtsZ-binding domain-containing protein [Noviherbaspirillum humi]SNS76627.1 Cell division protein ZipA, interacts with FtsZ [Noviherbaspirillum humi]